MGAPVFGFLRLGGKGLGDIFDPLNGDHQSFRAPDPAIARYLAKRQASKGTIPDVGIEALVEMLVPSGALSGDDVECDQETNQIVASMSDLNDPLTPDDPNYKAIRLARMVALSHALKPILRSIAVERGITDETGWPIDKPRDVDDRDIERAPETSSRLYYRGPTETNMTAIGDES